MFFWLLRSTFTLLVTAAVCALVVTVPVGKRTLFEHAVAIFTTEPARELGRALVETGQNLATKVSSAVEQAQQGAEPASASPPTATLADGSDTATP